jgi:type II secretory pathway component GspD/PulD (secretin)
MKKAILIITVACAAGFFVPAIAQTDVNNDGTNAPPMDQSDQSAQPAASDQTDMSGDQTQPPSDQLPADQTQIPADQSGQTAPADQTAPAPNESLAPDKMILPNENAKTGAQMNTGFVPPAGTTNANPDQLRLNFRNVPLDLVLNYLSDAAGFVIVLDTQVHGNVSVISSHPMTRDEAVDLLNSVLNQNGYAAIRDGRTLTIVNKNDAKTRNIPVRVGNDPDAVPDNDEIVTQIIPIRYVDATQLISDLSSFVSPQATVVANQAGNSIVITDTQENIRHIMEIIRAIDSSAAGETEIRVFNLSYANPNDVATELGNLFPSSSSGNGTQLPIRFDGGGGRGGFFARMAAAAGGNNGQNDRAQKQSQVTAVADARTQSVIVMASKDLMTEIGEMVQQLDVPSSRDQKVYVYHMNNGDPQQALQVLQGMFQGNSTSRGSSSSQQTENSALIQRANQNATTVGNTSSTLSSGLNGNGTGRGGGGSGIP